MHEAYQCCDGLAICKRGFTLLQLALGSNFSVSDILPRYDKSSTVNFILLFEIQKTQSAMFVSDDDVFVNKIIVVGLQIQQPPHGETWVNTPTLQKDINVGR
ncbi:hypothetical protein V1477_011425 [Vespula maculifrons]|uniref:Uncharacterized protein n=1 Tax=Vespula maculifrons TaxID=7453 RepID=A0ABD2BZ71_VESMC